MDSHVSIMELEALQKAATELASLSLRRDDPSMAAHLLRANAVVERFAKAHRARSRMPAFSSEGDGRHQTASHLGCASSPLDE